MLQRKSLSNRWAGVLAGVGAGILVELLAIVAALISAGAGHGSYVLARLLFPFSSLLMLLEGEIGPLGMFVGLLQYPIYGALAEYAISSERFRIAGALLALHLFAALACFSGILSNFV